MEILPYAIEFRPSCLGIFDSNQAHYFDSTERNDFETFLDSEVFDIAYFVVCEGNKVLGCGGYSYAGNTVTLRWGMVDRSHHKMNIGKALLQYRIEKIKSENRAKSIALDTSQHTKHFYENFGFKVEQEVRNGFGEGLNSVHMKLELRPKRDE